MKKSLVTLILFLFGSFYFCKSAAQITVINAPQQPKQEDVDLPYDSLTNISKENFRSQIGQTLYFIESNHYIEMGGVHIS